MAFSKRLGYVLLALTSTVSASIDTVPIALYGPNLPVLTDISNSTRTNLTESFENVVKTGDFPHGHIPMNESSFSLAVFDKSGILWQHHHTADSEVLDPTSTKNIDENTIYRIGSVSKLLAVYTFLARTGWRHLHTPVTHFILELAKQAKECQASKDAVDCIDWDEITLEALFSQLAGIPRDYSGSDQSLNASEYGLPPSTQSQSYYECASNATACSADTYAAGVSSQHPIYSPFNQPTYSNAAFALLADALTNITGKGFPELLRGELLDPLAMKSTYSSLPPKGSNQIVPYNFTASSWNQTFRNGGPEGGLYSTVADMAKLGQSIMNHKILNKVKTNRWMKPTAHTASLRFSVGMPWEIYRYSPLASPAQLVEVYSKAGDLQGLVASYHSQLGLIPQYGLGYVVMSVGPQALGQSIEDIFIEPLLALLDQDQKKQAHDSSYNRTFNLSSGGKNGSLTFAVEDDAPGLNITSLTHDGFDFRKSLQTLLLGGKAGELRTVPTDLVKNGTNGNKITSWQMFASDGIAWNTTEAKETHYGQWAGLAQMLYNDVSGNELLVETDGSGKPVGVTVRVLNATYT